MKIHTWLRWGALGIIGVLGLVLLMQLTGQFLGSFQRGTVALQASDSYAESRDMVAEFGSGMGLNAAPTSRKAIGSALMDPSAEAPQAREMADNSATGGPTDEGRLVIRSAQLEVEVDNTEEAKVAAEGMLSALDGYVAGAKSYSGRNGVLGYRLTLKVPATQLETLVEQLETLGQKLQYQYQQQDVTSAVSDREFEIQRLTTLRETYRQMIEQFQDKPNVDLDQVLRINREISQVEGQLSRMQQSQRNTLAQVEYASVHLHLRPVPESSPVQTSQWSLKKSIVKGQQRLVQNLQSGVDGIIRFMADVTSWGPIVLIVLVLVFVFRRLWRRLR